MPVSTVPYAGLTSPLGGSVIVSGTAVSASSTSVDFTGIPSWVKRITVMFNGVSTNGTGSIRFQLGTSSGVTTSGYLGQVVQLGAGTGSGTSTAGFDGIDNSASNIRYGAVTFNLFGSNIWTINNGYNLGSSNYQYIYAGAVPLAATLDRVRVTTTNGTDTFDAGSINILYE